MKIRSITENKPQKKATLYHFKYQVLKTCFDWMSLSEKHELSQIVSLIFKGQLESLAESGQSTFILHGTVSLNFFEPIQNFAIFYTSQIFWSKREKIRQPTFFSFH